MAHLDARGDISVAIVVVYLAVFCLALILTIRHGFSRQAGWFYLVTFSIFKLVGGGCHIAAEEVTPTDETLYIIAFAAEGAGLAPLLLCTLGFVNVVGSRILADHSVLSVARLHLLRILTTVGLILSIVGSVNSSSSSGTESKRQQGLTYRRVGSALLAISYVLISALHFYFWTKSHLILDFQRSLLKGISCALPFLAVRVLYSLLSAFSPAVTLSSGSISNSSTSGLAKFNSITGSWAIFLFMSIVPELITTCIYIFFGLRLPISNGAAYQETATASPNASQIPLYGKSYATPNLPYPGTMYPPPNSHTTGRNYANV